MWLRIFSIVCLLIAMCAWLLVGCTENSLSFGPGETDGDSESQVDGVNADDLETVLMKGSSTTGGNAISVFLTFTAYNQSAAVTWSDIAIRLDSAYLPPSPGCDNTNGERLSAESGAVTLGLIEKADTELELRIPADRDFCSLDFNLPTKPVAFHAEGMTTEGVRVIIDTDLTGLLPFAAKNGNFRFEKDTAYHWLAVLDLEQMLPEGFLSNLETGDNGDILVDTENNALKMDDLIASIIEAFSLWGDSNGNHQIDEAELHDDNRLGGGSTTDPTDGDEDGDEDTPPECEECVGFAGAYCLEGAPTGPDCSLDVLTDATIVIEVDPEVECGYIISVESSVLITPIDPVKMVGCDLDSQVIPLILPICTTVWNREMERFEYSCEGCDIIFSKAACQAADGDEDGDADGDDDCEPIPPGCVPACENNVAMNCEVVTDPDGCLDLSWTSEACGPRACKVDYDQNLAWCSDEGLDLQDCLLNCGDGCYLPLHMVCGQDGNMWCPCEMACYGIDQADDPGLCSGSCTQQADGTQCDDGSPCTTADACLTGICTGTPLDCDDGVACTVDSCDPAFGCKHIDTCGGCMGQPDGAVCDDGNADTSNDVCRQGLCVGTPVGDGCVYDADCPPDLYCNRIAPQSSLGQCQGDHSGICVDVTEGGDCYDGNPCTTGDSCQSGFCVGNLDYCPDFHGMYCPDDELVCEEVLKIEVDSEQTCSYTLTFSMLDQSTETMTMDGCQSFRRNLPSNLCNVHYSAEDDAFEVACNWCGVTTFNKFNCGIR